MRYIYLKHFCFSCERDALYILEALLLLVRDALYILEALLLLVRDARLEEDGVGAELRVQQRHVAVHPHEEVHAAMSLAEVLLVLRQRHRAARAAERPA